MIKVKSWEVQRLEGKTKKYIYLTDPVQPELFYKHRRISFIKSLTQSSSVKISSKHLHSQTVRAKDMNF